MSKWTLRQQRTRQLFEGDVQEHTAAMRAVRYVRRHANEFHGAGVEDAVRVLTPLESFAWATQNAREGVASVLAAFQVPAELAFGETAHGLTVVGFKNPVTTGLYYCPGHRCMGGAPVTAADVTSSTECWNCGTRLLGPVVAPAQCDECGHAHVRGVKCVEDTFGSFMCGCTE